MNKQRRNALGKLMDRVEALRPRLESLRSEVESICAALDDIHAEEQDAFDSMPESLQESDRWQMTYDGLSKMEDINGSLTDVIDTLGIDVDDLLSMFDEARGQF